MANGTAQEIAPRALSAVLRELLLAQSQMDLARKLGVSQNWISVRVNGGLGSIQKGKLGKIARELGVTTQQLILMAETTESV